MAWDNSQTFTLGLLMTPAIMTQMKDNDQFLYDRVPNYDIITLDEATDPTVTSTSFTSVGASLLLATLTVNYGVVQFGFAARCINATPGIVFFDVFVDGAAHAGNDGIIAGFNSTIPFNVAFTRFHTGLSVASHTFEVRWKVTTGTGTMYAGSGGANIDFHPQFWVKEIIQ